MDFKVTTDDSTLQHHGVKGMKWGIRRVIRDGKVYAKETKKSKAREYGWNKQYKNREKLSDEKLKKLTDRLKDENTLRKNMTTAKQKKTYRNRERLKDEDLKKLVSRVNMEAELKKQINTVYSTDKKQARKLIKYVEMIPLEKVPTYGLPAKVIIKQIDNILKK